MVDSERWYACCPGVRMDQLPGQCKMRTHGDASCSRRHSSALMKNRIRTMKILIQVLAIILLTAFGAHARRWTGADGIKTFEGELTAYDPATGKVGVKLANGKELKFEQKVLSEADIAFLKERGKVEATVAGNPSNPGKLPAGSGGFTPRHYYKAKLEPVAHVLHGAGQCNAQDVEDYRKTLESYDPAIFMDYCGARGTNGGFAYGLKKKLDVFPKYTAVQLGLSMTTDGKPDQHYEHEVAAGKYDENLNDLFKGLKSLDVPIYIRIGYECNGYWNGYKPEEYKKAFQHVTTLIRKQKLNAATVWCVAPRGKLAEVMSYYPGDEWVDWWSVDIFRTQEFGNSKTIIEEAHKHGKPMMIGESTPHSVGVLDGEVSWNKWFKPYFELIRTSPGIKSFCYINWNWAQYPQWKNWGDARLQQNKVVADLYKKEMSLPLYQHASTKRNFEKSVPK